MALTSIGSQKTPGRPVEITFAPELGLPSENQTILLIGHAASGATGTNTIVAINNAGDVAAASGEAITKFGAGSELTLMVIAAVQANEGGSTFPPIKCCVLDSAEITIPTPAQTAIKAARLGISFLVSPYDMENDTAERDILKNLAQTMSGAQRVENGQFGSFGVAANFDVADPANLTAFDTQYLVGIYKRDSAPVKSLGETAARAAETANTAAQTAKNNAEEAEREVVNIRGTMRQQVIETQTAADKAKEEIAKAQADVNTAAGLAQQAATSRAASALQPLQTLQTLQRRVPCA
jgi:hypothetical protein